jgi:hypothetical protein
LSFTTIVYTKIGATFFSRYEMCGLREREVEAFDPGEFLARVIMHIPEPRRHLVGYYGWYSNVSRGKRLKAASKHERAVDGDTGPPSRKRCRAQQVSDMKHGR